MDSEAACHSLLPVHGLEWHVESVSLPVESAAAHGIYLCVSEFEAHLRMQASIFQGHGAWASVLLKRHLDQRWEAYFVLEELHQNRVLGTDQSPVI